MNSELNVSISINGSISSNNTLTGTLTDSSVLSGGLSMESTSYQTYGGSYDVIPSTESQTLNTMNKVMADDVSIRSIPYFETSNEYGKTVYIGSEI